MQVNYALGDSGRSWVVGERPVCYLTHGIIVLQQEHMVTYLRPLPVCRRWAKLPNVLVAQVRTAPQACLASENLWRLQLPVTATQACSLHE